MIHILATLIFAYLFSKWIAAEFKLSFPHGKNYGWLIATVLAISCASAFSYYEGGRVGNFVLHSVGGGVATALIFEYLKRGFRLKVSWRTELVLLFGLVSSLGALNELAEYAADSAGIAYFSYDRMDTWRDILANTLGALTCWSFLRLLRIIRKK